MAQQPKKVHIYWNNNSIAQIKSAERKKSYYENKGYTQTDTKVNSITGECSLTYEIRAKVN